MPYSVIKLVTDAFYASGIVSRRFQTVSGPQLSDGLDFLNDILADKTIEKDMIPYFTKYELFAVAGQERYFIPNLESIETLVFFINNVRYQMRSVDRKVYFGSSRADNIDSLPFNWHLERCQGGANLFMYFKPQTNYPLQIWGTFRLASVVINQDLESNTCTANLGVAAIPGNGITTANLGIASIIGTGIIAPGELIINDVDLNGTYATVNDLITYINNGAIPFTTAALVSGDFVLSNTVTSITLDTLGTVTTSGITFTEFITTTGINHKVFLAPGYLAPGALVVNNVDLTGNYASLTVFVNYINSGVIPYVNAQIIGTQFMLFAYQGHNINVATIGNSGFTNYITFSRFSTQYGPLNETYLPQGLDRFYINYLKFSLADRLCTEYNFSVPPAVARQLLQYQVWISKRSAPLDMTQTKISTFSNGNTISWSQINLGQSWGVPG